MAHLGRALCLPSLLICKAHLELTSLRVNRGTSAAASPLTLELTPGSNSACVCINYVEWAKLEKVRWFKAPTHVTGTWPRRQIKLNLINWVNSNKNCPTANFWPFRSQYSFDVDLELSLRRFLPYKKMERGAAEGKESKAQLVFCASSEWSGATACISPLSRRPCVQASDLCLWSCYRPGPRSAAPCGPNGSSHTASWELDRLHKC